jgi:hypothetical protein
MCDYDKAVPALKRAIAVLTSLGKSHDPTVHDCWLTMAECMFHLNMLDDAVLQWQEHRYIHILHAVLSLYRGQLPRPTMQA